MDAEDPVLTHLQCSICLDIFKTPLTLPCGHSFCQGCICEHWDREAATSAGAFSCPDCRLLFSPRPEPQKNVSLSKMVQEVRELRMSRALLPAVQTEPGAAPPLCQRHKKGLTLYCNTDSRCICCKCLLTGCRQHAVQEIEELSQQERKKLSDDLVASDRQQEHTEEEMEKWKSKIESIKDFHEKMVSGITAKFEQVQKSLEECQVLVVESVNCDNYVALTQAAEHVLHLQRHRQDLEKHRAEAQTLLMKDGVAFLEGLPQLLPVVAAPGSPNIQQCGSLQMEAVAKILPEVTRLLQQELPNLLHPEKPIESSGLLSAIGVNDACCIAATPRTALTDLKTFVHMAPATTCTLRTELYKDYRNLTFDPETANKYIEISQENCKATHKTRFRRINVPDSPKRFESWQVMCTEGFSEGSHYWEVDISTHFVELGVAYESLNRSKARENTIGRNVSSWSLQLRSMHHSVWHNGKETKLHSPMFTEIGVHLDLVEGSLTFYGIKDGFLQRLHSFSCIFSEKVFPVFWIGDDVIVTIHTVQNAANDAENEG